MAVCSSLAPDTGMYREGNLRLKVYTAKVDERQALKLLAAGKRQEAEEYLSRAEEKLSRGQEEKADATFLTDLQAAVGQIKSEHAADINPIRKRRAKERLRWKAEQTRSALRALEYRNQAWGEVLKIVQDRLGRQAAGAESYVESPFRVDSTALRGALSRRYGESYVREMERLAPGVCESAVKDAEALAEQAGAQSAR
ncbi:MAG: hypothetical protein NTY77_11205 [Elusimicrobia bacterium]|nr:hypothetical protein [Elusimicrobiota bacterium]